MTTLQFHPNSQPSPATGSAPFSRTKDSTQALIWNPLTAKADQRGIALEAKTALPVPIAILGVPFDMVTTADTLRQIGEMIDSRRPHYAATANVDFVVQALGDVELRRILTDADMVLCDGMPLVWASRMLGNALPERVAGSDLVPELLAEAERKAWRVFILGSANENLTRAAERVREKHPHLQLVGTYSPPFKPLLEMDQDDILDRIRAAQPDILLVAFGCPKQEKWINMQFRQAGVPFCIGVGQRSIFSPARCAVRRSGCNTTGWSGFIASCRSPAACPAAISPIFGFLATRFCDSGGRFAVSAVTPSIRSGLQPKPPRAASSRSSA